MSAGTPSPRMHNGGELANAELSELRHRARIRVNQILGYAEMLIEDTSAAGVTKGLEALRNIYSSGRAALVDINDALANRQSVDRLELPHLYDRVRPRSERILNCVDELLRDAEAWAGSDWQTDLYLIRKETLSLVELLSSAAPPQPVEDPVPARPKPASHVTGPRLMLVDGNATHRFKISRRLERAGYAIGAAASGTEALDLAAAEVFDLVLLDVMAPLTDGIETLGRLKKNPRFASVPVIAVSAPDELDGVVRAIEMGADDYVTKPFDPVLWRIRIDGVLERRRLRQELSFRDKLASQG
ncbi:MAG: hypothetical protein C5B51_27455 [Terriglobia bacterium]|nr:MAG: hypothetical protein C5B51_27455 [Terriglobia bacterium]